MKQLGRDAGFRVEGRELDELGVLGALRLHDAFAQRIAFAAQSRAHGSGHQ